VIVRPIAPTTLAMCPPLVITDDEVDEVVQALRGSLEQP
jgi:adenosylmethionine-8-amino-7-oxononanoate aminotransferase